MQNFSDNMPSNRKLCDLKWNGKSSGQTNAYTKSYCLKSLLSEIDPHILTNEIPDAFEQFVRALPKSLELRRAGFILAHQGNTAQDNTATDTSQVALTIIAISDREIVRAGLGVSIPRENSALYEICDSHCLKTITPADDFRGNFVERHALVVSASGCLGMYPLAVNQLSMGAVTLNCDCQSTISAYSEQLSESLEKLTNHIATIVTAIPAISPAIANQD